MVDIAIIGASGYTGGELLRILSRHDEAEIKIATSDRFADKPIYFVHGNLRGILNLKFEKFNIDRVIKHCDFVFFATPNGIAMRYVKQLLEVGIKVVDLSADFRFKDKSIYEKIYGIKHEAKDVDAPYGLTELNRKEIRNASIVANPGCYPTSIIPSIVPIIDIIDLERIVVDSKSGVSGAGASPKDVTHFPFINEDIIAYKIIGHRHVAEIEQELKKYTHQRVLINFTPHMIPVTRGILSTIHVFLKKEISEEEVRKRFLKCYENEKFIRILNIGEVPILNNIRGSNYLDIGGFLIDHERRRLVIIAAIDNLIKGASGQAVQNMNVMLNIKEEKGLDLIGQSP